MENETQVSVADLLNYAVDKNPVEFNNAFQELIAARIAGRLEDEKKIVAQNYFNNDDQSEEQPEEQAVEDEQQNNETEDENGGQQTDTETV